MSSTRIIGGSVGGRRIRTPEGSATRPTTDRVREALFSSLEAQLGSLTGLRVLDLYAGSGALGLEALSRGAAALTAVESDRRTARLVADNARELGLAAEVVGQPVARVLALSPERPYDLVLADPPYAFPNPEVEHVLGLLLTRGWLAAEALLVLERPARAPEPTWPEGVSEVRSRRYGETMLWYVRAGRGPADGPPNATTP